MTENLDGFIWGPPNTYDNITNADNTSIHGKYIKTFYMMKKFVMNNPIEGETMTEEEITNVALALTDHVIGVDRLPGYECMSWVK